MLEVASSDTTAANCELIDEAMPHVNSKYPLSAKSTSLYV